MQFKNLLTKLNYLDIKNNIFILFQIIISLFFIEINVYVILYIYLLMIEFIWNDINKLFLSNKFYYFIFYKNIILLLILFLTFEYTMLILYIFSIFQFLFISKLFLNKLNQYKTRFCINEDSFLKERELLKFFHNNWFYLFIFINLFILYLLSGNIFISIAMSISFILLFKEYKFLFYFLVSMFFLYLSTTTNTTLYKDYSISTFSTITNFAILNIATFFIILQLNYQKFFSTFILWNIIKSPASLFAFFPSFVLLFSFYFIESNNRIILFFGFDTYSLLVFLQTFSIVSLMGLLFYTKYFLETNILMKKIFKNIKIENNKYLLSNEESGLEAILNLIKNTIIKKDYNTSYSLFFNFACWTRFNINKIKYKSALYKHEQENKFASIFETILLILDKEDDVILQKYFIEAFDSIIFVNIDCNNFDKFKIIIDKFKDQLQNNLKKGNEEIAIKIYYMLYRNGYDILVKLQSINSCKYPFTGNDLYREYKDIYIEKNYQFINIAIKYKNIKFLKTFNIIKSLFDIENKNLWDGKYLDILISEKHTILKQYKFLIDKKETINFDDFEWLLPYTYFEKNENLCQKEFLSYTIDILVSLYVYSIEKKQIQYGDFGIIRGQINYSLENKHNKHFELFFRLYIFLIYKIHIADNQNMKSLFKWLIQDISDRYLSLKINGEFVNKEIKKLLNKCNLSDNYFEEVSNEVEESLSNYKSLDKTCWQEVFDLDKVVR